MIQKSNRVKKNKGRIRKNTEKWVAMDGQDVMSQLSPAVVRLTGIFRKVPWMEV
jgi:hypothetical protein